MSGLDSTTRGERIRIAFFGLRNAGKSTLANEFAGQPLSIVSEVAGTTTDPVSKAMEILPLGPCMVTDTAGLDDDQGELGAMRVEKTLAVLSVCDVAVWVASPGDASSPWPGRVEEDCRKRSVAFLVHRRGETAAALRTRIAALEIAERQRGIFDGMLDGVDRAVCVCPIDSSAPKGRLILPQVQTIRACLDAGIVCSVCDPRTLSKALAGLDGERTLVVTDSQAFASVRRSLKGTRFRLTSFSILFARQKGDLAAFAAGLEAIARLKDGDRVLVAEGCTHHRQCDDIGSVKIPAALRRTTGKRLEFDFASGPSFPAADAIAGAFALVVQCGGCMLTRREMMRRIATCREAGTPVVNYGMLLAAAAGLSGVRADGLVGL